MSTFTIKIIAEVETTITLGPNETLQDLKRRDVDIYLHGDGLYPYHDKVDLGCNKSNILIKELDEY